VTPCKEWFVRFARFAVLVSLVFASSALLGACGDDPLFPEVVLSVDTVTLTVPGADMPSALDLVQAQPPFTLLRRPELLRDAGEWDIALRRGESGLLLRPYTAPAASLRGAGIAPATEDYDRIREAPRATNAYADDPVAAGVGSTFFFRSRQYPTQAGTLCVNYAKAKVLAVDLAAGTARLALTQNENCDDERLEED
jgi:hypothetical protein